jgi:hypothetical protein
MRRIGWLLAVLLAGPGLASGVSSSRVPPTPTPIDADCSRRLHHGDMPEDSALTQPSPRRRWNAMQPSPRGKGDAAVPLRQPALHPWVVAVEEALVSLLALVALPVRRSKLPSRT